MRKLGHEDRAGCKVLRIFVKTDREASRIFLGAI